MNTPICDFVSNYIKGDPLRLHMPGHKGDPFLGMEKYDITEVSGADSLYDAEGIIAGSESNASGLFGCTTLYSTEGSSQCIKAMLHLAMIHCRERGTRPLIAAARNAHRAFMDGAALLGLDVMWLYPREGGSYLSWNMGEEELDRQLAEAGEKPGALYVTSPDYLGSTLDISAVARVCRKHDMLLLVDNAHGAYLRFLQGSRFPVDLGADMCCSSAHKTLPVLTGGAYLHMGNGMPEHIKAQAKGAMGLFGSTSPSYLILQSLDRANLYLEGYSARLAEFIPEVSALKARLMEGGWQQRGDEPLKLTLVTKPMGYRGSELGELLMEQNIICEFADPDHAVFMFTPETGKQGIERLEAALCALPRRAAVTECPPDFAVGQRVMSIREAALAPMESIPVRESEGRILAQAGVGCPPAVPILLCGERIDRRAIACFEYYGVEKCRVVKDARAKE